MDEIPLVGFGATPHRPKAPATAEKSRQSRPRAASKSSHKEAKMLGFQRDFIPLESQRFANCLTLKISLPKPQTSGMLNNDNQIPYKERLRDGPDETRQPSHMRKVANPAARQRWQIRSITNLTRLHCLQARFCVAAYALASYPRLTALSNWQRKGLTGQFV